MGVPLLLGVASIWFPRKPFLFPSGDPSVSFYSGLVSVGHLVAGPSPWEGFGALPVKGSSDLVPMLD